jgi:hypothetical protein
VVARVLPVAYIKDKSWHQQRFIVVRAVFLFGVGPNKSDVSEVPLPSVNELPMNFATGRVDYRYLKVLIVGKALFVKALCEVSAMRNRIGVGLEIQSNPISEWNAVYHVKEKFLHIQSTLVRIVCQPILVPE